MHAVPRRAGNARMVLASSAPVGGAATADRAAADKVVAADRVAPSAELYRT
jgi:hypothetical protein